MAVESTMLALGSPLPEFDLPDVRTGDKVSSADLSGDANVVIFLCNHCPYVKRIADGLAAFGNDFADDDQVRMVAIASNDAEQYPDDAPDELARIADEVGYPFPVLYDESQEVARAWGAERTPDVFVLDSGLRLRYRGAPDADYDDPSQGATWVRESLDALLEGREPERFETEPVGCTIKWR